MKLGLQFRADMAIYDVNVRAADARGNDLDEDFTVLWGIERDVLDLELALCLWDNSSLEGFWERHFCLWGQLRKLVSRIRYRI